MTMNFMKTCDSRLLIWIWIWSNSAGVHAGLRVSLVKIWVSAEECDLPWFLRRPPQLGILGAYWWEGRRLAAASAVLAASADRPLRGGLGVAASA